MKNWKKLLFVAIAAMPVGLLKADCCNTSTDCCGNNNSGCCGTDTTACCAGGHITNKSVYIDIGFGASGTYLHENFFRNDRMNMADEGWGGAFQAVFFGGKTSDNGKNGLGRRFGLNHKRCMVAAEGTDADMITNGINRDVDVQHFNIATNDGNFQSTFCFCPEQKFAGALLSWKQAIFCHDDGEARWWFEINAPIVHVNNNMNLTETITNPGGGARTDDGVVVTGLDNSPVVGSMKDAFKQSNWKYGKIDGCREHTELANLEVKLGYNEIRGGCCNLSSYIGFAAKTTACRTAQYVFEPVVGQEHWAFMWGSNFDLEICEWENSSLGVHFAMDSRWWFERAEKRSFDLIGKPWGRYMEMYANVEDATANVNSVLGGTSGINLMTRDVCVTPGYQINCNMALTYTGCRFTAEAGHTFYARSAEKVAPNWVTGPALKDAGGDGQTNIARTISHQFVCAATSLANYDRSLIQKCDVDWNSGAHEGILAHTFYGALAYSFDDWCYPSFISIGGAFDFDAEDEGTSVMRRWTIFGKLGVSF